MDLIDHDYFPVKRIYMRQKTLIMTQGQFDQLNSVETGLKMKINLMKTILLRNNC